MYWQGPRDKKRSNILVEVDRAKDSSEDGKRKIKRNRLYVLTV